MGPAGGIKAVLPYYDMPTQASLKDSINDRALIRLIATRYGHNANKVLDAFSFERDNYSRDYERSLSRARRRPRTGHH